MKLTVARRPRSESTQGHLPVFTMPASVDSPRPAEDAIEERLDIGRLLVQRPASTFFVRVEGEGMVDGSIQPGDILVVDRAVQPRNNEIVIAVIEGEFTVKQLSTKPYIRLVSQNQSVEIRQPFEVWGTVLWIVHKAH